MNTIKTYEMENHNADGGFEQIGDNDKQAMKKGIDKQPKSALCVVYMIVKARKWFFSWFARGFSVVRGESSREREAVLAFLLLRRVLTEPPRVVWQERALYIWFGWSDSHDWYRLQLIGTY